MFSPATRKPQGFVEVAMSSYLISLRVLGLHRPLKSALEVVFSTVVMLTLIIIVVAGMSKRGLLFLKSHNENENNTTTSLFIYLISGSQVCFMSLHFMIFNIKHIKLYGEFIDTLTNICLILNRKLQFEKYYIRFCKRQTILTLSLGGFILGKYLLIWGKIFKFNDATASLILKTLT